MRPAYRVAATLFVVSAVAGAAADSSQTGYKDTIVRVVDPSEPTKNVKVAAGGYFEIDYWIADGIGGNPKNFTAEVKDGSEVVTAYQNLKVESPRSVGATTLRAIFKAEKPGKATVMLSVKGGKNLAKTYQITVTEKGPEDRP